MVEILNSIPTKFIFYLKKITYCPLFEVSLLTVDFLSYIANIGLDLFDWADLVLLETETFFFTEELSAEEVSPKVRFKILC